MKVLKNILSCKVFYILLFISSLVFASFKIFSGVSSSYDYISNVVVKVKNINFYNEKYKLVFEDFNSEKIIGYCDFCSDVSLGDKVVISGKDIKFAKNILPNNFNYEEYLKRNNIFHVINISKINILNKNKQNIYKVKSWFLRRSFKASKSYPYLNYLLFHDDSYVDDEIILAYQDCSVLHLFSVSGLHLGFFLVILKKMFKKFKYGMFLSFLCLLFYAFIIDFSISFLRALFFYFLCLIYKKLDLNVDKKYILLLVVSLFIWFRPFIIFDLGFLYSFVITFFLITWKNIFKCSYFKRLFYVSLISFVVSFPITIFNFYQVNFSSIFLNMFFSIMVTCLIFPFSILVFIFPFLDSYFYNIMVFFNKIIFFCRDNLSFNVIFGKPSYFLIFLYFVIIIILFGILFKYKKVIFSLLVVLFVVLKLIIKDNSDYLMVVDVDQGDMLILYVDGEVNLIDTGGKISNNIGKYEHYYSYSLINYLKSKGISKINRVFISHGDYDHMGDSVSLVNNFKVLNVIFNCGEYNELEKELIGVLERKNIKYYSCINELNINNYKLQFLNTGIYDNENDNSSVMYFNYNNFKFLFMGDTGVKREKDILNKYNLTDIDIDFFKVGHHGSNTSSSEEFINSIKPKYSFISVGKNNKYGHPKKSVLDVLKNSKIYRTDIDGSIEIKLNKNGYKIRTYPP